MPKAYVFTRYGGPETEALVEVDRPSPGPGEILVAVRAAGVNPVDWKQRTGYRRPGETGSHAFPAVFGNEVAGVVEETGAGVDGFAVGDEVFGSAVGGAYAESRCWPRRSPRTSPPRCRSRTRPPCPSPRRPPTTESVSSTCPPARPC